MFSKRSTLVARPARPIRALAALLATLAAGLLVPALAGAEWTTPVDLSKAGQDASQPQVAVDADGDAVFTWVRSDGANFRVQARARSAAGILSPVQTLSSSGQDASDPQVAVDADGDAVFTWRRFDGTNHRIQARARSAAGALSPVQNLSDPGQSAFFPQVGVDADGDAVFTWERFDGANSRVQARARSAAGALSGVQDLSAAGQTALDPQVAVRRKNGAAVFTWVRSDGTNNRVQARARSAAGTLSAVQTLSSAGQNAAEPQVAVDADGDGVFTWRRFDGANSRVQARARTAAGTLSAVQTLSDPGENAFEPRVAVRRGNGDAVFAWRRPDGTDCGGFACLRIQARARSAAGALSAVQNLSDPGQIAAEPGVAVDATGDAVFAWRRSDEANLLRVEARSRSAAGALRPITILSDPGQSAFAPQVAVDDDGDAVVTWQRSDGANSRIQASAGP
jgi:hypothetical protein